MKKINKKDIITFIITFAITCIIFIPFLTGHYATDTYNVANVGYHRYAIEWSLNDGRIFMSAITLLAGKLNLSIETFSFITLFLALIVSCISVLKVKKIIGKFKAPKNIWQEILITIISYITIFNFMYIEDMYFVEGFIMAISQLLFILAADILVEKNKNYIVKSLLLVIVGIMFYQGSICMFFAMTFLISLLKNKNNIKTIIVDLIKSGIIALIGVLLNISLVSAVGKIYGMEQTRLNSLNKIFYNINKIIKNTYVVLAGTCDLFPRYLFLIFTAIIFILTIIYSSKDKKTDSTLIKMVGIFIIAILSSSVVFILAYTSFYSGRLRLSIGALIGMIFILLYVETDIFEKGKILKYSMITVLIAYVTITIYQYIYLMTQHKKVNRLEKDDVQKIENYIEQYENKTQNKITKIVKIRVLGKSEEAYYPIIKNKSTFTFTAIRSDLAADAVINFYTGRNLETVTDFNYHNIEEEFIKKIISSENAYICIGDTFYINVYMF